MHEAGLIERTSIPATRESLRSDLHGLGIRPGDTLLVHCSLQSLGWVSGGPVAVVQALLDAAGTYGTIAMPTHSRDLTDPANWGAPPVPLTWIEIIRATMPAFEPATTPSSGMGAVAELFRTWPGARRSAHPATSMAALGRHAEEITAQHALSDPLGLTSPSGSLYRLKAKVLLIGVGFNRCTALHLAEHMRWPDRPTIQEGAPIIVDGERKWVEFKVPTVMDDDKFLSVGDAVMAERIATSGPMAQAQAIVADMAKLVDFAVDHWSGVMHPAA
ncbi:aminoglycoside N(3)-acetyltransferase [Devosia sp. RR2S18]|uniref:aminoglycoside N(3)-acetyltransferase n=1 Tax=Devosia rhizosphaerae TaxID=3049774 RepID=UPI0025415E9E|nr:AAC(3) family N-acetyltransferase [Devosia sp. RR2S18]WIJ25347.1 AAC(3) family N-acetyltransferase [Devosia sp. RR2S18]